VILRHDRPDRECVVDEADWPAIVTFFGGDGGGTVVAGRWVLTAAHTAANIPAGHRFPVGGVETPVRRVVAHPAGIDLALVELDCRGAGVAPILLYDRDDEAGREAMLLGRGDFGNGLEGVLGTDRRLRRVTNRVESADARWLRFGFEAPPAGTALEGVGGEGDSGGPALIRGGAGLRVAGVSSWQDHDGPLGTYGCMEHYTRLSPHVTWIRDVCEPAT
jgi:Trypsin